MRELTIGKANYAQKGNAIQFRWHDWAFVLEADLPSDISAQVAEISRANHENTAFLKCLAKATEEGVNVSHSASAGNYAPKQFAKMPTGKGITRKGFEAALQRLLHLGTIRANQNVFQYPNRTWAKGLKLMPESAQKVAQNPAQKAGNGCTKVPSEF